MKSMFRYAVLVGSVVVMGQLAKCQLPEAPKAKMDRVEVGLLVADAGSRALDVYSTHWMLGQGDHEMMLPGFVAKHPAVMGAVEGVDIAAQYWLARRLEKRGHRKLAHLATEIDLGIDLPWAIHNLYLPKKRTVPTWIR
jgi:hypothetical protein